MNDMMACNFKIQNLHLLNVQVSGYYPLLSMSFMSNFRASLATSSPMNKPHKSFTLMVSSAATAETAPVSVVVSDSPNEHSFVVSYLIKSCGLSPELALAKARIVKFKSPEKPDRVLAFFKKHGFPKFAVSKIVAQFPKLLICNPEKALLPKLEFLRSLGLSNREITGVISRVPFILKRSMESIVIPSYNLLRSLLSSDDEAINMVKGYPWILALEPEVNEVEILLEVGVPPKNIVSSWKYRRRSYGLLTDFRKIVEDVKEMGFDPSSMNFLWAVTAIRSLSKSNWEKKVQVFKKYGWSDYDFLVAFEKCPRFIFSSADQIDAVLDFLVNQMGMEAASIANWPVILSKSLKKRIVPRCSIYLVMLEKGLVKERKLSISTLLSITEKEFLRRVLEPYEDVAPELFTLYQDMLDVRKG